MKKDLYSIEGKVLKQVELPKQFNEPVRHDLIKRAVLAIHSSKRTPYGADPEAGKRSSSILSKRRRRYRGSYGRGISRSPRKVLTKRGSQFYFVGAFATNTVGGRRSHPPKSGKKWLLDINKKERRKAIRSALAATINESLVKARGHKVEKIPSIVESKIENISKTKEIKQVLFSLGLKEELLRVSKKKVRAGRGKLRGRKYKVKTGPLLVVSKNCPLEKSAVNMLGVDVCQIKDINAELLAPGTIPGRLTVYTEDALKILEEKKLFTNEKVREDKK